jgi:hypothetical protein
MTKFKGNDGVHLINTDKRLTLVAPAKAAAHPKAPAAPAPPKAPAPAPKPKAAKSDED